MQHDSFDDYDTTASDRQFQLGQWTVLPSLNRVKRGDTIVRLEVKAMDVLVFLASRHPCLATRHQIIDEVWGAEFISDNTLTHAIAMLRSALGDDAKNPTYIETIHRRGYRLLMPTTEVDHYTQTSIGKPSRFSILTPSGPVNLEEGENLIGRLPGATVSIESVQVSTLHALVYIRGDSAFLRDLDSKTGTLLNGKPVSRSTRLVEGDRISLGACVEPLRFAPAVDEVPTEVDDTTSDRLLVS